MTSTSMLRTQERPASQSERPDDDVCINTIRTLAMDAVQKANSGHPGTPMGLAPVVYTLWKEFLRYDPDDPLWPDRDRFVLSAGHASMLLYALLHLARVRRLHGDGITSEPAVSLDDIKRFRQIESVTPGHPEYGLTTGVENEELRREGIAARVVSMPSWELFEQQDGGYREAVLPAHITARVTVEQGSVIGWDRYAGQSGAIVGMHRFGASAPWKDLLAKFGFSPQKVLEAAKAQIAEAQPDKGHTAK